MRGCITALAPDGRLVILRSWTGPADRQVDIRRVQVGEAARRTDDLVRLVRLVDEGALTLRVAGVFPAAHAAQAHHRLEAGGLRGRLVLDLNNLDE